MPEYEVISAFNKKDFPPKDGQKAKKVIGMKLKVGEEQRSTEWFTDHDTPLPQPESKIEGDLELGDYGWKFKPIRRGGGGRGGGRSEEDNRRIVRQHSQKCAVDLIRAAHDLGLLKPKTDGETAMERVSDLASMAVQIAHYLENDVYRTESK
jgi:hypothetical protein